LQSGVAHYVTNGQQHRAVFADAGGHG